MQLFSRQDDQANKWCGARSSKFNKRSAHLTTAERCTPINNLWLTAIYNVFDRVKADIRHMTATAEHCIASFGLNTHRHYTKLFCHCQYAYMRLNKVLAVVVSNLLLYGIAPRSGWLHFACLLRLQLHDDRLWLSRCNVMSCVSTK